MTQQNLGNRAALAAAAVVALSLLSCAAPEPPSAGATGSIAWYEEQVEEGFGQLDALPRNWSAQPR